MQLNGFPAPYSNSEMQRTLHGCDMAKGIQSEHNQPQFWIRGSAEDGYFAHVWFGYKPSEQYDISPTVDDAVQEVLNDYPHALRVDNLK